MLSFYPFYLLVLDSDSLAGFQHLAWLQPETAGEVSQKAAKPLPPQRDPEDTAIQDILHRVADRWQEREQTTLGKKATETILTDPLQTLGKAPPMKGPVPRQAVVDDLAETVIIGSADKPSQISQPASAPVNVENSAQQARDLTETTIITSSDSVQPDQQSVEIPGPAAPQQVEDDDLLTETIFLDPNKKS